MKRHIGFIIFLAVAIVVWFLWTYSTYKASPDASKQDLEKVKIELQRQIDSVLRETALIRTELDTIKDEVRTVNAKTDTIMAGQRVIYEEITRQDENDDNFLYKLLKKLL